MEKVMLGKREQKRLLSELKNNLVMSIESKAAYIDKLDKIIYQELNDKEIIIYRILLETEATIKLTRVANFDTINALKIDKSQLHELACENTKKRLKPYIKTYTQTVIDTGMKDGLSREEVKSLVPKIPFPYDFYFLGNERECNQKAGLLMDEMLDEFATNHDTNLFLITTNRDGFIVLMSKQLTMEQAISVLDKLNPQSIKEEMYYFDKDMKKVHRVELAVARKEYAKLEIDRPLDKGGKKYGR